MTICVPRPSVTVMGYGEASLSGCAAGWALDAAELFSEFPPANREKLMRKRMLMLSNTRMIRFMGYSCNKNAYRVVMYGGSRLLAPGPCKSNLEDASMENQPSQCPSGKTILRIPVTVARPQRILTAFR
jgi:hypothetical protein